ncbi:type II toxin-antitoxin system YafQ family toxin [Tissierella praeacuta]|uniref:type II toxin-antitoxin system RelE/ParE family toxin n=1 Tax=Tissierella praeacuta TaxID=43131 RepID=UPI001C1225F7|nr:type II toxin-antitoxin system mRNA interferase toxin, RelE/StbE family [Tissierella praeacuta]MBU5254595.1 type II toxin-antitoxin system mRNA interferase toxin, RelE/StbE family [Tissierella praeacuta]
MKKKVLSLLLVLCITLTSFNSFAFASKVDYTSDYIVLEDGTKITEDELIEYLIANKDKIYKISDDWDDNSIVLDINNSSNEISPRSVAVAIPAWAIGEWIIAGIGAVIVTPTAIRLGNKVVEAGSKLFNTIIDAIENIVFSSDGKKSNERKVEETSRAKRQKKKLTKEQLKEYEKAKKALEKNDTNKLKQLEDHALKGDRKGQRALDLKGSGRGRGKLRIIYEVEKGTIRIVEIVDYH